MKKERYNEFTKIEHDNFIAITKEEKAGMSFDSNGCLCKIFFISNGEEYYASRGMIEYRLRNKKTKKAELHMIKKVVFFLKKVNPYCFNNVEQKLKNDSQIFELISN